MGFRLAHLAAGVARAAASSSRLRGPRPAASALVAPLLASPWEPSGGGQPHWLVPSRGHVGHSHHHHHGEEVGGEASERIFRLGLAADVVLTVGKAVTGYLSGSTAIAADAAHSLSDIVLSGVALLSYKAAKAPRDKEHPYGHGKFESLGALGISSGIAWHAFDVLQGVMSSAPDIIGNVSHAHHSHGSSGHHHGIDLEHPILALSVTAFAISVKEGLYWITKRAGEKEGSGLMKANAWHHRSDAISSVVALLGVGGSILGVPYLDPLAGLVVSGMILKAGVHTGYESVLELVDAAVDPSLLQPIKETILQVDGVKVYPFLSVSAAHDIGETVRHQIQKSHNQVAEVFIHIVESNMDQKGIWENIERRNSDAIPRQQTAEAIVSCIISSHFSKVEVSMSPEIMIRDAMDIAKQAEEEILKADSSISQVSVQLRLGQQIKQLKLPGGKNRAKNQQAQMQ
uniref:Cation efflux protein transmembrane domain-containing protein n=1 Tax=Oryza barthii TaxID=65489 RepID=A0A0D3FIE4_9ORYZ